MRIIKIIWEDSSDNSTFDRYYKTELNNKQITKVITEAIKSRDLAWENDMLDCDSEHIEAFFEENGLKETKVYDDEFEMIY